MRAVRLRPPPRRRRAAFHRRVASCWIFCTAVPGPLMGTHLALSSARTGSEKSNSSNVDAARASSASLAALPNSRIHQRAPRVLLARRRHRSTRVLEVFSLQCRRRPRPRSRYPPPFAAVPPASTPVFINSWSPFLARRCRRRRGSPSNATVHIIARRTRFKIRLATCSRCECVGRTPDTCSPTRRFARTWASTCTTTSDAVAARCLGASDARARAPRSVWARGSAS